MIFSLGQANAHDGTTHVAIANEVLRQLREAANGGDAPESLIFEVGGTRLEVTIDYQEAYAAILDHPEYFRAGAIGADAFPDPLTGNLLNKGNVSDVVRNEVFDIRVDLQNDTNPAPPRPRILAPDVPLQNRRGPLEWRGGDFGIAMLRFAEGGGYNFGPGERPRVLAFIMGYLTSGISESFANDWANDFRVQISV